MDWSELGAIRSRFVENKDEIRFWTSLALDGAKVSAIVGTSSGLFIVVAYLRSVGAPLPITDISATVAFLVIAGAYGFVAIFLVATLYSPALVCAVSPRDRRIAGLRPLDPDLPKLRRLMIIASYYILFHAGPLAVIAVTICGPRHRDHAFACLCHIAAPITGAGISVLWLGHHPISAQIETKISFKDEAAHGVFWGSIKRSLWCLIWAVTIMGFAEALFPNIFVARLAVGAAAFVVYCFLAVGTTFKRYLVGVSLAVALIGVFLPSYCGKRSLYLLGIGGGIPVVVLMKPMLGQNVDGCLIVNMGGRLIVWPMPEPTEAACRDLAPEGTPGGVPALSRVVMISQVDIEQIKPPPKHGQGSVFAD